jgi:hypothetical protein
LFSIFKWLLFHPELSRFKRNMFFFFFFNFQTKHGYS